jgi:hypothetical protein
MHGRRVWLRRYPEGLAHNQQIISAVLQFRDIVSLQHNSTVRTFECN